MNMPDEKRDYGVSDMDRIYFESNGKSFRQNPGNRRSSSSYDVRSGRNKLRKKSGPLGVVFSLGNILFFPLMFVYLELVFHISMKLQMKYLPIFVFFAISFGFIISIFTLLFNRTINKIITYLFTILGCLLFCIEMVCKTVLSSYYQLLSSADTAANNRLTDYMGAILSGIMQKLFSIFLLILPIVFIFTIGRMYFSFKRKSLPLFGTVLVFGIFFHLFGLLSLKFPWSGDFVPSKLYASDSNVEDQVEQLGIITMLRLDVKHTVFGGASNLDLDDSDFSNLDVLNPNGSPKATKNPSSSKDPSTSTEPNATVEPTATPIDTSPNVMDIDFDKLIAKSKNKNIEWLNKYYSNCTPTNKNEYTGMFKGYNVIFVTMEGFSKHLIDKDRTPTLYKMANEGFVFNNYYTPLHFTSTSGGEWQNLTGLYPKNGNPISMKESGIQGTNLYFTLAHQLNRIGYTSLGYHNNNEMYGRKKSHPNLGYDWHQGGMGFELEKTASGKNVWPQSDKYMIDTTVDDYLKSNKPFNIYYLTVSGHMPYNFGGDQMAVKNKDIVANLPYSDVTKAYIAANMEVEYAMKSLLDKLEAAGIADKTLIVMSPDHIPYFDVASLEEISGKTFGGSALKNLNESDIDFDVYKNSLIMWSGSMKEPIPVDKICSQVDILPTVSNLLGLEYDSRLLAGSDILSDSSPLVIFSSSCWKTDKGFYNRYTGEFTPAKDVKMSKSETEEYVAAMKKIVQYKLQSSALIVEEDYYETVFPGKK